MWTAVRWLTRAWRKRPCLPAAAVARGEAGGWAGLAAEAGAAPTCTAPPTHNLLVSSLPCWTTGPTHSFVFVCRLLVSLPRQNTLEAAAPYSNAEVIAASLARDNSSMHVKVRRH